MSRLPARDRFRRGQAIVFVALGLVAMTAMVGLAVDLGWSFYVRKAARGAADSAALAAVKRAIANGSVSGAYSCTMTTCPATGICTYCLAKTPCAAVPTGTNLENGCQYATRNGFPKAGSEAEEVFMEAGLGPFTTATGTVNSWYWVTARVQRQVPRLFSRVLKSEDQLVTAKATAALVDAIVDGSLILLNRENDPVVFTVGSGGNATEKKMYGPNMFVQANDNHGMYAVQTDGGIRMASECNGTNSTGPTNCRDGTKPLFAGMNSGGGTVKASDIAVRGAGDVDKSGSARWIPPDISHPSGGFNDPMAGKTQPPAPTGLQDKPILGSNVLDASQCPASGCESGRYYATEAVTDPTKRAALGCGATGNCYVATGAPIAIKGDVVFNGGAFGEYVFYGGITKSNSKASVKFGPGRYVFAGALTSNGPGVLLDTATNFALYDSTTGYGRAGDAGELFIFTNGTYSGNMTATPTTWWKPGLEKELNYGTANFQAGNNNTYINLHGLEPTMAPDDLKNYGPVLVWWDRNNSYVTHDATGIVDPTCATTLINCYNTQAFGKSPELGIQASPSVHLYGVIYQPRGAWTTLQGGAGYSGPLQIITGALNVQGNANISLTAPDTPLTVTVTALIE